MQMFWIGRGRNGKSAYAKQLIRKGVEILRFNGKPLSYEETVKLKGDRESFALQISDNFYLYLDEPARYFNHSCDPNCGLKDLRLVAIRDIAEGEELTFDYSTTMWERDWNMTCDCGKIICRHRILDFDKLPAATRKYYADLGIVQSFILEKMKFKKS